MVVTVEEALATMRAYPKDPKAWLTLGEALAHVGDVQKARQCYERALALEPQMSQAQAALQALGGATMPPPPDGSESAEAQPPLKTAPLVSPGMDSEPTQEPVRPHDAQAPARPETTTVYDDPAQFEKINAYVIPGETLYAVYDCTEAERDFVGVTDQRVLFHDRGKGMLRHKDQVVSLPYHRVIGVAAAEKEVTLLTVIGNFSFAFRTAEKAFWVYSFVMHQILHQVHPQLPG